MRRFLFPTLFATIGGLAWRNRRRFLDRKSGGITDPTPLPTRSDPAFR